MIKSREREGAYILCGILSEAVCCAMGNAGVASEAGDVRADMLGEDGLGLPTGGALLALAKPVAHEKGSARQRGGRNSQREVFHLIFYANHCLV